MQGWGGSLVVSLTPHLQWKCQQACALQGLIKTCLSLTPSQHCQTGRFILSDHISFINTYLPLWFIGFSDTHLLVFRTRVSFLNTYVSVCHNYRTSLINYTESEISFAIRLSSNDLYSKHPSSYIWVKTLPNTCLWF